uniref:Filamin A interacting protein 1 like n=1 Tax=Paramormyrops kingsleyae TaxID=1676925 RepID=A0A3B3SPF4_9TELE|nr:filamin A-interacting protein 1-like [Paramormyrops kingsleyae]
MTAKLTTSDTHNRQLRQKLSALSRKLDEQENTNKIFRRDEEERPDLRDKISRSDFRNSSLMSEVEELTNRVLEIEGKDEELIKLENHCQDLTETLEIESTKGQSLRAEVDTLNCRIIELEKLEDAFSKSKQECCMLRSNLEKEKSVSKHLSDELDMLKTKIKELEAMESQMEKTEHTLKEDLTKLKALTVILVDERKTMAEKIKQMEEKLQRSPGKVLAEQDRVTRVTEKLTGENKRGLTPQARLEEKIQNVTRDREELKEKLKAEEERSNDLQMKVNMMKKKLQSMEVVEREFLKNKAKEEDIKMSSNQFHHEDNKVKDLAQEVERLKRKIKDMRLVEDGLLKTEDEFQALQKRYNNEQQRAKKLLEELEISKNELSKYQMAEKKDNQEDLLYKCLKEEEAKSRHLIRELEVLKEKLNEFIGTEESICRLKKDHSILQKKLTQEEMKNKELAREMEKLAAELERYRHIGKNLRPGLNARHSTDLQVSSKEVQTTLSSSQPMEYKSLPLLERPVLNGKVYTEGDVEDDSNYRKLPFTKCRTSLVNNASTLNKTMRHSFPITKERQKPVVSSKAMTRQNGNYVQQGDVVVRHAPGQPLHIKVTPDHGLNTAMLEISSPGAENAHSYTSTAVIPTSGAPPKQQITIIQNANVSPPKIKTPSSPDGLCTPDRPTSPVSMAAFSRVMSPESSVCLTPERALSPIQIVSVTTGSPDRPQSTEFVEVVGSHAVFRLAQERQNWQLERSSSSAPSVITTEDNKIHIHLGNSYIQAINNTSHPTNPCYVSEQRHRSSGIFSGNSVTKGDSKITSSLTITPNTSPTSRHPHITVSSL